MWTHRYQDSLEMIIWRNLLGLHDNMRHKAVEVVSAHHFLNYLVLCLKRKV